MNLGNHHRRTPVLAAMAVALGITLGAVAPAHAIWVPQPGEKPNIERIIDSMTLEEKVGQLIMIGFGGTELTSHSTHWVRNRRVGGVALFSRNIKELEQTARLTREIQGLAEGHIPVFLALDQEGGNVIRVKEGAMLLPGNMAMGATRSPTLAYVAGQALAIDLKRLGFNMNLAPVLDVNSNPNNPVIGIRSYGERPDLVGHLGAWYVRGQQEMGVVAVAKHFPGHGDTQSDSHYSMPSIDADFERLRALELRPFKEAVDAGLDAIMTAHIAVPKITGDPELPATLSRIILADTLRRQMGFQGVVITDGLEMQGIAQRYGSGRAAVLAILAGADMPMVLWTPKVKEEVYRSLLGAAKSGEISRKRLDRSVRRILRIKAKRGLFDRSLEKLERVVRRGNKNPIHDQVSARIARESVTLVRNHGDILPLRSVRYRRVVVMAPSGRFASQMGQEPNVEVITVPYVPSRSARKAAVAKIISRASKADLFVVAVVNNYHVGMVRRITAALPQLPVAMVSLASPYYLSSVPDVDAYVCTYSYLGVSQGAAADAILGRNPMNGRLPVSIPGFYDYGHRVEERMTTHLGGDTSTASVR